MTDKIFDNLRTTDLYQQEVKKIIDETSLYYHIRTLLTDGYLSFEKIYDTHKVVGLNPLDPCTLVKTIDNTWIQYPDNKISKRVLTDNQVIYLSYSDLKSYSLLSYVEELKESYEKVKRHENELVYSRASLPGGVKVGGKMTFKLLNRADKQLKFVSKIPKSILKLECSTSTDIRYNKFILRISEIFRSQLFEKIK